MHTLKYHAFGHIADGEDSFGSKHIARMSCVECLQPPTKLVGIQFTGDSQRNGLDFVAVWQARRRRISALGTTAHSLRDPLQVESAEVKNSV